MTDDWQKAREDWWSKLAVKGDPVLQTDSWKAFEAGFKAGVAKERERCVKVLQSHPYKDSKDD